VVAWLLAAFIVIHGTDGQLIYLNGEQITNLREPRGIGQHFPRTARCIVFQADGRFVVSSMSCAQIQQLLNDKATD
jgi:hypothetical protein